jgi:hypothetical protein
VNKRITEDEQCEHGFRVQTNGCIRGETATADKKNKLIYKTKKRL